MSRTGLGLTAAAIIGTSSLVIPSFAPVEAHVNQDMPPAARPGECYGRVTTAPQYGVVEKKVLVSEAWSETRVGPPSVEKVTRKVLVREARVERVQRPAVYRDVVSWVEKPGRARTVTEPARYKTVTDKVLVEPERLEWRLTSAPLAYGETRVGAPQTMLQATGEVYCRVRIPARYEHVERRIKIASARSYTVPGKPVRIKKVERVLVRPAGMIERTIPAVYRTEVVKTVTRPGRAKVVTHPAVYKTVRQTSLVKQHGEGWALVVCGGEINPAFMAQVQSALIAQGYDPGPPNGVGHPQTYAALRNYQRDRGFAQGQLTVESARALGLL